MAAKWIALPHVEGTASRQAHADLPPGTYERELGREGFYGPSTQMHHRHAPTAWSAFEGPLRPRAFDTTKLTAMHASPWDATPLIGNAHLQMRLWQTDRSMDRLVAHTHRGGILFLPEG